METGLKQLNAIKAKDIRALVLDVDKPDVLIALPYPVRCRIATFQTMESFPPKTARQKKIPANCHALLVEVVLEGEARA